MKRFPHWINPLGAGVILVALWYAVRSLFHIPSNVLPSPHEILAAAWRERAVLTSAVLLTAQGAVLGFLAAVTGGFLIAMALGFSPRIKASFYPYILVLQLIPVPILAPIFVLWLRVCPPSSRSAS